MPFRPILLAGVLATAGTSNAFAVEAQDVAERLKELMARQQVELNYDNAELSGGDVTLQGVTVKSTSAETSFDLGTLVLQDVTEEQDGSVRVGEFEMDAFEHQADDITVSMEDLAITGMVLPEDVDTDPYGGAFRYERMVVARIDVEGEDGPIASLSDLHSDLAIADDQTMTMDAVVEAFSLDLAALVEDDEGTARLEELGYSELSGSAFMEASWQPSDGRMTMSRYDVAVDDAGTFAMTTDLSGYTPEFIRSLQETVEAMEKQQGSDDKGMQGMAMLGLMQQLTLHGVTIRFVDDSLTGKLLELFAEKQGTSPANLITLAKAAIPQQIAPFVGAEFAATVGEAVGTFLENPDSIEIGAQPERPLPFGMLMMAMSSPETLVRQLGLSIKAND